MAFYPKKTKLHDCEFADELESELFIVEGDSASKSVVRARDARFQAVLPMQGKPMNAWKARKPAVQRNDLFQALISAIGAEWDDEFQLESMRYDRVLLLFDPDADGIHCGALALMFFYRWMRPILDRGRLFVVRPPLYQIVSLDQSESLLAYTDEHYNRLREALNSKGMEYKGSRFRGLANMNDTTLRDSCINPDTRRAFRLAEDDAVAAVRAFGGTSKSWPKN